MVEISNLTTPSPEWWEVAIKGMRNSYKATDKSDSKFKLTFEVTREDCLKCTNYYSGKCHGTPDNLYLCGLILGENDQQLLLKLCKAGTFHRKVLRQLPVIMDITAPLYFWKQMDQYKLGTVTNSESTMHTLMNKEFELSDFSADCLDDVRGCIAFEDSQQRWTQGCDGDEYLKFYTIPFLNSLRDDYLTIKSYLNSFNKGDFSLAMGFTWNFLEENAEHFTEEQLVELAEEEMSKYWNAINELLPQSYNQKRTWSANYEVLVNIIEQRRGHKLKEWDDFIDYLLENVPYLREIVEAVDE